MTTPGQPNPPVSTPALSTPASSGALGSPSAASPPSAGSPGAGSSPAPSSSSASLTPPSPTPSSPTPASPTPPRTSTPPKPPAPPGAPKASGNSAAAGAYLLAVVALVIAVAAGAAAAYAVKTAWEVRDANNPSALESPTPTAGRGGSATPTAPASSSTGTRTPTPTQTTPSGPEYVADLERAQVNVTLPAASSCNSAYVDVDTLAVGDAAATGHEFYLATCGSPLRIFLDRTSGRAISTVANPSPAACHERVTGTPSSELAVAVEQGQTFCLLTNRAQANAQSLPQRLAIVTVELLTATQARLAVSTYQIVA